MGSKTNNNHKPTNETKKTKETNHSLVKRRALARVERKGTFHNHNNAGRKKHAWNNETKERRKSLSSSRLFVVIQQTDVHTVSNTLRRIFSKIMIGFAMFKILLSLSLST